jgi:hypothetical protein
LQLQQEPAHSEEKINLPTFQKGVSLEQKAIAEDLGQLQNNLPDQSLEGLESLWANSTSY